MLINQSKDLFKSHWVVWKISGIIPPKKCRVPYLIWSFAFNVGITLLYPIHLIFGLFKIETKAEVFKNLVANISDLSCTLKFLILWYNLKNIRHIEMLLDTLDKRIQTTEEKECFKNVIKKGKMIVLVFGITFACALILSELSTLIDEQRRLLYPAWFPMDWQASNINYWIANMYQFIGISLQINYDFASDTYPPVSLALLSGHVRLLAIRVSKLGIDPSKSLKDNNKELVQCIKDHQNLIKLYQCMQAVLSLGTFFQIFVTGFNLCCTIIYLAFYADNLFAIAYCCVYCVCQTLEIFPCCYYGSIFEMEVSKLPYAIFSSNWMEQDMEFKKNLIMFSERCLQSTTFLCMGLLPIHLETFYVTVKSGYSLFTVMLQTK